MALPKICTNKFFLMAVTASFIFTTTLVFNVVFPLIDTQAQEINIIQEDVKQILQDTGYIKAKIENLE